MDDLAIRVKGFRDMQRVLKDAPRELRLEMKRDLIEVAEPVRQDAQQLAGRRIRNLLSPTAEVNWAEMRVGVTTRSVYIAPKQRGSKARKDRRFRRPNLADLLMGRAMEPALQANEGRIAARFEHVLDIVGERWESV